MCDFFLSLSRYCNLNKIWRNELCAEVVVFMRRKIKLDKRNYRKINVLGKWNKALWIRSESSIEDKAFIRNDLMIKSDIQIAYVQ